jgi:small subunit ribosomal protein S17
MAEEEKDQTETSEGEPTSDATAASASDAAPPSDDSAAAPSEGEAQSQPPAGEERADAPEEAALEPEVPPEQVAEALTPKERRRRERAAKAASQPQRPQRGPEERHAERLQERRKAQVRRVSRLRRREKERARRTETAATPPREHAPGKQKTRQGVVVSDRADKTITVRIDITRRHRRYQKIVRTSNTLHAHDERNDAHIGDTVIVRESRPRSRSKRWRLVEVVERAE